jgi:hypothetical protein
MYMAQRFCPGILFSVFTSGIRVLHAFLDILRPSRGDMDKATGLRVQQGMTNGVLISLSRVSATVDYGNDRVKTSGPTQVVQGFDKLFGDLR